MPKTSKSKVHVRETSPVLIEATKGPKTLTLEQRKRQAEEPVFLDRM
jgi:hypothetical protein